MTTISSSDSSVSQPNSLATTSSPGKEAASEENVELKRTSFAPLEETSQTEKSKNDVSVRKREVSTEAPSRLSSDSAKGKTTESKSADVEMQKPMNLAERVQLGRFLLEAANQ